MVAVFLLLFPVLADAQLTSTFFTANVGRGYDQGWEVDSVVFVYQRYPHDESLFTIKMTQNTTVDTHSYYAAIAPASYNVNFTMNAWALAYLSTFSYPVPIDVQPAPFQTFSVDTMYGGVTATATVDTAAVARTVWAPIAEGGVGLAARTVTSSASGTGVYSDSLKVLRTSDSTGIGAGATVWLRPNDGGNYLTDLTDANGVAEFSVDADTFIVYVWASGYQLVTSPDTNGVANKDTVYTVWMSATVASSPSSAALAGVTFNFFDGTGDSVKNVVLQYNLDSKEVAIHFDSTKIIDPSTVFEARSDGSGQVTVYVIPNDSLYLPGYRTGETRWQFRAFTPDGRVLLGQDGVKLNVSTSGVTYTYPKDF